MASEPAILILNSWGDMDDCIESAGGEVLSVSEYSPDERLWAEGGILSYCNGVVFTGGGDVSPTYYNRPEHMDTYGLLETRDKQEFAVAKYCLQENIPMFGVCRGMQLINVACGGTLIQDLPTLPRADDHWGKIHPIAVRKNSKFHRAVGTNHIFGESFHHQAIDIMGNGLVPSGWSHDGIIEALESTPRTDQLIMCTQFHPEMDATQSDSSGNIFNYWVWMVAKKYGIKIERKKGKIRKSYKWWTAGEFNEHGLGYSDEGKWKPAYSSSSKMFWEADDGWNDYGCQSYEQERAEVDKMLARKEIDIIHGITDRMTPELAERSALNEDYD